jgi:GT2 family glycosyltransferase
MDSIALNVSCDAELLLWDNGQDLRVVKNYLDTHPKFPIPVMIGTQNRNLGFSKAAHFAANYPSPRKPRAFLFLNPDGILASPLTPEIYEKLYRENALLGLRVFNDNAKTQRQASARSFPSFASLLGNRESTLTKFWPTNPWTNKYLLHHLDPNQAHKVDWVSGCAMFISKENWEKIGGFDTRFFLYAEDVDLGKKAALNQIPVFYFPVVDFIHYIRGSSHGRSLRSDLYHHKAMWKYFLKWSHPFLKIFSPLIAIGIALRFFLRRVLR